MSHDSPDERAASPRTAATGDQAPEHDGAPNRHDGAVPASPVEQSPSAAVPPPESAVPIVVESPSQPILDFTAQRQLRWLQRIVLGLLLLGHLLLYVFVDRIQDLWWPWSELRIFSLLVQVSLCLTWIILGPGRPRWRVPLGLATLSGLIFLDLRDSILEASAMLAAVVLPCLAIIRLAGFSLLRPRRAPKQPGARYSLRSLLLLTTGVAVAAASAAPARAIIYNQLQRPGDDSLFVMLHLWMLEAVMAYLVLGGLWACLRPGNPLGRLFAYLALAVGVGGHLIYLVSDNLDTTDAAIFLTVIAILSLLTYGVLRLAGYRLLSWEERNAAAVDLPLQPPASPTPPIADLATGSAAAGPSQ